MLRRSLLAAILLFAAAPAHSRESAPAPDVQNIVRLRPVMVPILTNGQVERYATYDITLEIASPSRIPEIQGKLPHLQDAATGVMYEAVDKGWIARGAIANGTALRARLAEACNALLGKGAVSRVLIAPALPRQL